MVQPISRFSKILKIKAPCVIRNCAHAFILNDDRYACETCCKQCCHQWCWVSGIPKAPLMIIDTVRGSKRMRVFCCSAIYSSNNLRMRLRSLHHFVKVLENHDTVDICITQIQRMRSFKHLHLFTWRRFCKWFKRFINTYNDLEKVPNYKYQTPIVYVDLRSIFKLI